MADRHVVRQTETEAVRFGLQEKETDTQRDREGARHEDRHVGRQRQTTETEAVRFGLQEKETNTQRHRKRGMKTDRHVGRQRPNYRDGDGGCESLR